MNMWDNAASNQDAGFAYIVLKTALSQFSKSPNELTPEELEKVNRQAKVQYKIQSCVLRSDEARDLSVPDSMIEASVNEVASRYDNKEAFIEDLQKGGMDLNTFQESIKRELHVETVMERVASKSVDVNDLDAKIFYHLHPDRFAKPETREVRHILITINEEYPENSEPKARERIERIYENLQHKPKKFNELAQKHSECPTAMHGGLLGKIKPGVLFPELDDIAFKLKKNQMSGIVKSEMGFHILKCDSILPPQKMSMSEALPKIKEYLKTKQQQKCQKFWLAQQLKNYDG